MSTVRVGLVSDSHGRFAATTAMTAKTWPSIRASRSTPSWAITTI